MRLLGGPAPRIAILTAVIGMVFVLLAQLAQWYDHRDLVTGAQGTFPAAFATEAPVAPGHVIRRTTDDEFHALAQGLYLQTTDTGVKAVNLRTGKEYWRYERRDSDYALVWNFAVSKRTVVAVYADGKLVGIDLRTGKQLWRTELRHVEGYRLVSLAGGQAVTHEPGAVRAFDERDGRSLWTVKTPKTCPGVLVYTVYDLPDRLSAIAVMCNVTTPDQEQYNLLIGVDNRSPSGRSAPTTRSRRSGPTNRHWWSARRRTLMSRSPSTYSTSTAKVPLHAPTCPPTRGTRSDREAAPWCWPQTRRRAGATTTPSCVPTTPRTDTAPGN
ncbi:outer membrane protein assembly factor BamB family protein [Streptomyces sp. NPDC002577]